MNLVKTEIPGLVIIEPNVHEDERGYFFESYNHNDFVAKGLDFTFVQDNESRSSYGVVRGLHYQLAPFDMIRGILAHVSTLFMLVGIPHSPFSAGKGGLCLGIPLPP